MSNSEQVIIHPTAIIEPGAELDSGVSVGAYTTIGKNVKIGKNSIIHSNTLVTGYTTVGSSCQIFSFASVGNLPQDLKYKGEPTTLEIGSNNIIREFVTMQPGTATGISKTVVGNNNLFMAYVHVAHDCVIGNNNIFANLTQLSGHVTVGDWVVFGGMTAIHQFSYIGDMAMTGGGTVASQDIPPFCIAEGNRATLRGLNVVGLQRRGLNVETRNAIRKAYKILFLSQHASTEISIQSIPDEIMQYAEVKKLADFVKNSKRGVVRPTNTRHLSVQES